jgi:hypothetical protein
MGRFTDEWVIDRVLFDHVAGGACACCGFQHFMPTSTADWIRAVSDLDTDQVSQEIRAVNDPESVWPVELREAVWSDRVRIRQYLKRQIGDYNEFNERHGEAFRQWCRQQSVESWRRWLQMPRSQVLEQVRNEFHLHPAYAVVLCAVVEQVAFFSLTGYPPDGRGVSELDFERLLNYNKRGGFGLPIAREGVDDEKKDDANGDEADEQSDDDEEDSASLYVDERVLQVFVGRCEALGGPRLLEKYGSDRVSSKKDDCEDENNNDGDGDADGANGQARTSFSSDRRIVRLIIARYWARLVQTQYLNSLKDGEASSTMPSTAHTSDN